MTNRTCLDDVLVERLKDFAKAHPWLQISGDYNLNRLDTCIRDDECPVLRFGCSDFEFDFEDMDEDLDDDEMSDDCQSCTNFNNTSPPYCSLHPDAYDDWKAFKKAYIKESDLIDNGCYGDEEPENDDAMVIGDGTARLSGDGEFNDDEESDGCLIDRPWP